MNDVSVQERINALTMLAALAIIALLMAPKGAPGPRAPFTPDAMRTVTGTLTCLPHKQQAKAVTLECISGIRAENGDYYALDLESVSTKTMRYDYRGSATVRGHYTPRAALSSSHWQAYEMLGIITVETIEN